jgi:hypothetical protein
LTVHDHADLASDINAYLRIAAGRGRTTERVGPFLATFSPDNNNQFLNYAIPDDAAEPTEADVQDLVAAYEGRERVPRLEYMPDAALAVEAALIAGGFSIEARVALMVCAEGEERVVSPPSGIEVTAPDTDDDYLGLAATQGEAYGSPGAPDPRRVAGMRAFVDAGGVYVLARDLAGGDGRRWRARRYSTPRHN